MVVLESLGGSSVVIPSTSAVKLEPLVELQCQQFKGSPPPSVVPMDIDSNSNNAMDAMDISETPSVAAATLTNTEIVRLQQKRIEELQRQLQRYARSQLALQQQQQHSSLQQSASASPSTLASSPASVTSLVGSPLSSSLAASPPPIVISGNSVTHTQQQQAVQGSQTSDVTKPLHRQLLQQHLQHKMQLQQMQNQQQNVSTVNGIIASSGGSPTSAAVKASLAAFLHSQQQAANHQEQNSANNNNSSNNNSVANNNNNSNSNSGAGSLSSAVSVASPGSPSQSLESPSEKSNRSPPAVLLNHQRTSSMPNFTSMLNGNPQGQSKALPQQNGSIGSPPEQPQFVISRPPPNYDEATKQLNKQQFAAGVLNHLSGKGKGQKAFKSQAVDDVLEILIKNGELPPSAAQEPPTPTTPESAKATGSSSSSQPPVFPAVSSPAAANNPSGEAEQSPSSVASKVSGGSPSPPPPTLSLMEPLTPPPSMLADAEAANTSALDFDFNLDLDDIEAMDLGALSSAETPMPKDTVPLSVPANSDLDVMNNMDMELTDWLDVMIPTSSGNGNVGSSTITSCGTSSSSYTNGLNTYGSGHDPLLSNLGHSHDPFDLFAVDDMDFKVSNDLSTLSWDKVDFAA